MPGANCARCRRSISLGDTVESDGLGVVHVNCRNPAQPHCRRARVPACVLLGPCGRPVSHVRPELSAARPCLGIVRRLHLSYLSLFVRRCGSYREHSRSSQELHGASRATSAQSAGGTRGHPATCQAGSAARRPRRRLAARDRSGPRRPPRNEKTSSSNARAVKDSVRGRAHPLDVRSAHFTVMAITSRSCTPQE